MGKKVKEFEVFMELELPIYGKVSIIEGLGIHLFKALSKSKGDTGLMIKYLILELLVVNDNFVSEEFLDNMRLKDVSYLNTIIGTMMDNTFSKGF